MAPLNAVYVQLAKFQTDLTRSQQGAVLAGAVAAIGFFYIIVSAIQYIHLSPLGKVPGPKLRAVSNIPYIISLCTGKVVRDVHALHEKYGPVVRIGPDQVSFIAPQAWKDIYGHRVRGAKSFVKDPKFYTLPANGVNSIIQSNDKDHSRMRKLLSHAFSEKALREQEPLINSYVDMLIGRLRGKTAQPVDMVKWYNYTTFDIIGDLAFGSSFGCLDGGEYHPWVAMIFKSIKTGSFQSVSKRIPQLKPLSRFFASPEMVKQRIETQNLATERVNARLETGVSRPDFMSEILRHNDEKGMSLPEIHSNANLLIIAGSETTATLLSGCTYLLLTNPDVYQKLVAEIRGSFRNESEMTMSALGQMKYMLAVLEESFRMYPPVPIGFSRLTPEGGAKIEGYTIPEGTSVSVSQWPAYRNPENFAEPNSFIPERWLENADPKFASDKKAVLQPFSYGPRNCLGRNLAYSEMRLILARVLWNFDLVLTKESEQWIQQKTYTLWDKPPLMVQLRPVKR